MALNRWVPPSLIDTDDGLTATRATTGGGSVTVSVAVPDTPPTVAVIVVEPASTPVANPDELMVATEALLLVHVNVLPDIIVLSESKAVALNCWVPPSLIDTDDGLNVTRATTGGDSVTVSVAVPDTPSTVALIVVEPASTPVTNPDELMVATEALLLVHVNVLPDIIVLSESKAVALNCWVPPSSIDTDDGLNVTRSTTGGGSVTVNVAVPDTPSTVALIVVEPASSPVANPDELMVATEALLLVHVNVLPDIIVLSESKAVALNCWVPPSSIDTDDGLNVTRATTGGGSVTVSVAVPDTPSTVAVIVVEPASTPVANPDESMVATEVLLLVQVKVLPDIIVSSEP